LYPPCFLRQLQKGAVPTSTNLQMLMDGRVDLSLNWSDQE
jgi:hypothetical protein